MNSLPPLLLVVGPPEHGVAQYAADLAAAVVRREPRTRVATHLALDGVAVAELPAGERVHLHVTDRLLGGSPEEAAHTVERLAARTTLSITLHDVPQSSDGTMQQRRQAAYTRIATAAQRVAVNSRHEQLLCAEFLPGIGAVHPIPLGTRPRPAAQPAVRPTRPLAPDLRVLIAGYIYPGKGHAPAVRAAADAARSLRDAGDAVGDVVVRAIGAPSRGHEADADRLREDADREGVRFEVTGFLDGAEFANELGSDGIPLAAHEHVSASRSMLDWGEAGRRLLVADSRYAAEMDALRPGMLRRYAPPELPSALVAAWREPALTDLPPGATLAPDLDDAGAAYLRWWEDAA